MAPALSGERIRSGSWRGAGVRVDEVLAQLVRMEAALRSDEPGHDTEDQHPHPRSAALNLVIVADGTVGAERVGGITKDIAAHHPARVIVIIHGDDDPEEGISAAIDVHAHQLVQGCLIQHERIKLEAHGEAGHHLRSLVDPFLLPDVPTHLWWMGDAPLRERRFRSDAGLADALIIDSSAFSRPLDSMLDLADLAGTAAVARLGDFQWIRLRHWRELLAQLFNPSSRRPLLHGIKSLGIDYQAAGGNPAGGALLAGWLQSQLGWTLRNALAGSGGALQARFETAGHLPLELDLRPVETARRLPGEVVAIRLQAAAGARGLDLRSELNGRGDQVEVSFDLGHETLRQLRSCPPLDDGQLLLNVLLDGGQDSVYHQALAAGVELLKAMP